MNRLPVHATFTRYIQNLTPQSSSCLSMAVNASYTGENHFLRLSSQ